MSPQTARNLSSILLISLTFLCLSWELWLAPLRPGGSWWVLKTVPLLVPLFGVLHGRRYTYQWLSLLIWFYVLEGATRTASEHGLGQILALIELVLGVELFICLVWYLHSRNGCRSN